MTPCICPSPSGLLSWLKDFSFVGTWLLVIIGWLVVNSQNNARERRKESRSLVESIEELVLGIEVAAREYYALSGADPAGQALALQIKAGFRTLSSRLKVLGRYSTKFNATDELIAFRTAVTGGDFESASRAACPPTHCIYAAISADAGALISLLNLRYAEQ